MCSETANDRSGLGVWFLLFIKTREGFVNQNVLLST
jgi:hypothetical protein